MQRLNKEYAEVLQFQCIRIRICICRDELYKKESVIIKIVRGEIFFLCVSIEKIKFDKFITFLLIIFSSRLLTLVKMLNGR